MALTVSASAQEGPRLTRPVDCVLGQSCYIQQYVDRDPSPGRLDFACGALANDGHDGTDFAVPTEADMRRGVRVVAALSGLVRATRDEMPDIRQGTPDAPDVTGQECGNGVLIAHDGGWETQYCHLMRGSVRVSPGESVAAGDVLGFVGLSGEASFPHVHFSLRRDGETIDPFRPDLAGSEPPAACGGAVGALWDVPIDYRAGSLIAAGLLDRVPSFDEVKTGLPEDGLPDGAPAAMVAWGYIANGMTGDIVGFEIEAPDGTSFGGHQDTLERDQPFLFRAWGRRAPPQGLPSGPWRATLTLSRDGQEIDRHVVMGAVD